MERGKPATPISTEQTFPRLRLWSKAERVGPKVERRFITISEPQPIVTIVVGSPLTKRTFSVHKNVLCASSTLFEKQPSKHLNMSLPDFTPSSFGIFMRWLYTNQILFGSTAIDEGDHVDVADLHNNDFIVLADTWIFANHFHIGDLQNGLVDIMVSYMKIETWNALGDFYSLAYRVTYDKLRNLAVAHFAIVVDEEWFESMLDELPEAMVNDVAKYQKKATSRMAAGRLDFVLKAEDLCDLENRAHSRYSHPDF